MIAQVLRSVKRPIDKRTQAVLDLRQGTAVTKKAVRHFPEKGGERDGELLELYLEVHDMLGRPDLHIGHKSVLTARFAPERSA